MLSIITGLYPEQLLKKDVNILAFAANVDNSDNF
jgi:hypothetical protein